MDVNLEHILVSAKYRKAPLTPETAGYLTLAVTDALLRTPCRPGPRHVTLSATGDIAIERAPKATSEQEAAAAARKLLGYLLSVSSGSAPALSACARRQTDATVAQLIEELESSLIPVNRGAGQRALVRLVREAARASLPPGARWVPPGTIPQRRPNEEPTADETEIAPTEDDSVVQTTQVDTSLAPASSDGPAVATPAPRSTEAQTEAVSAAQSEDDGLLTYEPPDVDPGASELAPMLRDEGLETYEPPAVGQSEDPTLDMLTASPPEAAQVDSETSSAQPSQTSKPVAQDNESSPSSQGRGEDTGTKEQSNEHLFGANDVDRGAGRSVSEPTAQHPDRVGELLSQMKPIQARSTKQVSHELKDMLGLPPTPPPADVQLDQSEHDALDGEDKPAEDLLVDEPSPETIAASEQQRKRISFFLMVTLLVVAIGVLIAVYIKFPRMLMGG